MNSSLPESPYEGPIAMKMVKSSASNSAHDQFLEEASICAIFEHANICKLIGLILGLVSKRKPSVYGSKRISKISNWKSER